jgi:hypothetical protein
VYPVFIFHVISFSSNFRYFLSFWSHSILHALFNIPMVAILSLSIILLILFYICSTVQQIFPYRICHLSVCSSYVRVSTVFHSFFLLLFLLLYALSYSKSSLSYFIISSSFSLTFTCHLTLNLFCYSPTVALLSFLFFLPSFRIYFLIAHPSFFSVLFVSSHSKSVTSLPFYKFSVLVLPSMLLVCYYSKICSFTY